MKRTFLVAAALALCFAFTPAIGNAGSFSRLSFQGSSERHQTATKIFSGTVAKQGDIFVLSDRADKTNYQLVDSSKLGEFVGKTVKVTGTLDAENLTIHVQDIQEIA